MGKDVYDVYSLDGTNHFIEKKMSETPFLPGASKKMADYISITADKGVIAPVWMRIDGEHESVWTITIKQEELFKKADMPKLQTTLRRPSGSYPLQPRPGQGGRSHKSF